MKYSDKYEVKYSHTFNGCTYELSDTLDNLFEINTPYDMSIVYTKGNTDLTLETTDHVSGSNVWEITSSPNTFGRTLYNKTLKKLYTGIKQEKRIAFVMSTSRVGGGAIDYSNNYFISGNNTDKTAKAITNSFRNMAFLLNANINDFVIIVPNLEVTDGTINKTMTLSELIEDPDNWYIRSVPNLQMHFKQGISGQWISQGASPVYVCNNNDMYSVYPVLFDYFNQIKSMSISVYSNTNVPSANTRVSRSYKWLSGTDKYILAGETPNFNFNWNNDIGGSLPAVNTTFKTESNSDFLRLYWFSTLNVTSAGVINNAVISTRNCLKGSVFLRELAYCGCFIGSSSPTTLDEKSMWNENYWLGEMDKNGFTTGVLIRGDEVETSKTVNKTGTIQRIDFNPDKPSGGDDVDIIEEMTIGLNFTAGGMINYYRVTLDALNNLSAALSDPDIVPAGKDVLPNLISLKQFYINKDNIINEAFPSTDEIIIAGVHTGVTGHKINSTFTYIPLGEYLINGKFGSIENPSYLDYEPYTTIELYIPFCGWTNIPTSCMYKTINVKLLYDIVTGTCMSVVSCDGLIVSQSAGVMCEDLPFKAENVGLKTANMIHGIMGIAGSTAGMFSNAMAGNTGGLVLSGGDVLSSITNAVITNNQNYTQIKGATGDSCVFGLPKKCYIKIQRPITKEPENYKHEKGYPVMESFNLSEISGFTICENVDLTGLTCTEEEKQMLKNLLESGIYL